MALKMCFRASRQRHLSKWLSGPSCRTWWLKSVRFRTHRFLGIVIFSRADIARSAVSQNFGQFAKPYESFELRWDREQALRLVYWLTQKPGELPDLVDDIQQLNETRLRDLLEPLWGQKLGSQSAREARTADWVLAALSDFNGRIQARDLVRLVQYAASDSSRSVNFPDRVLTPQSIRDAVEKCSAKKIGGN